jgi:hypothetical protein
LELVTAVRIRPGVYSFFRLHGISNPFRFRFIVFSMSPLTVAQLDPFSVIRPEYLCDELHLTAISMGERRYETENNQYR